MSHSPHRPPLEPPVWAPWQAPGAAAGTSPALLPALVRCRPDLLPRVAAYYTQLQALPRRVRRALQRQWRLSLAGIALLLALGQYPVLAATIPVNAGCTLVDAIAAANADTATGGCPAGLGADTIVLPAGSTQTLTEVNNSTYGPTGLPVISSMVTIAGHGSTIARDSGAPEFRLFAVNSTGELTLQETTVSGGALPSGRNGGGVANYGGTLTVLNSTLSGNAAVPYCPFFCYGGSGGSVYNGGTLIVRNSIISDNSARYGGGVSNSRFAGTLTVRNSTISGNSARYGHGGGVHNAGPLTVMDSIISGNSAGIGGGVYNAGGSGPLTVRNSTISGNSADIGGGVSNGGPLTVRNSTISGNSAGIGGGGVRNGFGGTLTVTNSTISGNSAAFGGGMSNGFYGPGSASTLTVRNSTISGNSAGMGGGVRNGLAGTLTLAHTMVAGNTAPTGPEIYNDVNFGTLTVANHNLFGENGNAGGEGFTPGATDVVPPAGIQLADILNPTLTFNGGPTQTHALVSGSPAIDAGGLVCTDANGAPLPTDQRGQPRLVDGDGDGTAACDIGAFEFFSLVNDFVTLDAAPKTHFDSTPVSGGPAGTFTITATFTNTSDTPLRFPFFTVTALSGDNLLLNAAEGIMGVGATLTPEVGDSMLAPGETITVDFLVGLQAQERFRFFVDLFGEPLR